MLETKPTVAKQISADGSSNVGQVPNNVSAAQESLEPSTQRPSGCKINVRFALCNNQTSKRANAPGDTMQQSSVFITGSVSMTVVSDQLLCVCVCVHLRR